MTDFTLSMPTFAKKTERKTVRMFGMSRKGLKISLRSVDCNIVSITERDISETGNST